MAITGIGSLKKSEGGAYELLPADVYQVQIISMELQEGEYEGKLTKQIFFKCQIVEEDNKGKPCNFWTSLSWNLGGGKYKPSFLYLLVAAVYKYYRKDVIITQMEEITEDELNALVGKQVRVTVEVRSSNGKEKNKVTGYMPIKSEIAFEPVTKEEQDEAQKEFEKMVGITQ